MKSRRRMLSWTLEALRRAGIKPLESMGQHFLVDPRGLRVFERGLVRARGQECLEVGPGLGVTTWLASRYASKVIAVELDRRLLGVLAEGLPDNAQAVIGEGVSFAGATRSPLIFSNTPYSISSRLIATAARNNSVKVMVLGVQAEVAERVVAEPGTRDYGRLTVLVNRYFEARLLGYLPRHYYYPRPDVAGGVVELRRRRVWGRDGEPFEKLTSCLFSSRNRKAGKVAAACLEKVFGVSGVSLDWLGSLRVRDLEVGHIERIMRLVS